MESQPLISIVTPSYNQGRFLRETLQSLVDQEYPNLEVIIQDGGSTDDSVAIAEEFVRRHPAVFRLFVEKDQGQADALNRGFARARGEILGFLNSDDTLYPSILHRVAAEIDPHRKRWVVMGRCLFTGDGERYVGVEHPAEYKSHFTHLAIWKRGFNTIPQPSVFWHRKVWEICGGFNIREHHALDYDLFCRFSEHYRFHRVDERWSTFRMHAVSKSAQKTESEVLALSINVSRRYWGAWWRPLRWRCELSHSLHTRNAHEHARHHARRAEEAAAGGRTLTTLSEFVKTAFYSPAMARDRLLQAWIVRRKLRVLERFIWSGESFTTRYTDLWIGPLYREKIAVPKAGTKLVVILQHTPQGYHQNVTVSLAVNGKEIENKSFTEQAQFSLAADVSALGGKSVVFEIRSSAYFVPRFVHNTPDDRQLSVQLFETRIDVAPAKESAATRIEDPTI